MGKQGKEYDQELWKCDELPRGNTWRQWSVNKDILGAVGGK